MKAVLVQPENRQHVLQLVHDLESPRPGPNDVLVTVRASALNRADLRHSTSHFKSSETGPTHPIGGLEMTGTIAALGSNVSEFAVGDRVMAMTGSAWAEQVVVPASLAMPVPDRLSWQAAAATPVSFVTAYDALVRAAQLRPPETILIQGGTTAVGLAGLQLARALNSGEVAGTSRSQWKLDRLQEMGFSAFPPGSQALADFVDSASAGRGADIILDVIGGPAIANNLELAAIQARLVCVGRVGGSEGVLNLDEFARKRLHMLGLTFRTRSMEERIAAIRAFTTGGLPLIADGAVQPLIDKVFPLEQIEEAEAYMTAGETFGKIVIDVGSE